MSASPPFYLDWQFWAFGTAALALVLSQMPPVYLLIRRGKLSCETIDQILVNFPEQSRTERDRLLTEKAKIKADRALRDWTTAQFYESGDYYRGARYYYQKICKEFPDTPFSAKAQERLAAIQGKPDNPPDRYEFLNYIFGPPNGKAGMRPK